MDKADFTRMKARCAELARSGKELRIAWTNGQRAPVFRLLLDGAEVPADPVVDMILDPKNQTLYAISSLSDCLLNEGSALFKESTSSFYTDTWVNQGLTRYMDVSLKIFIPKACWFEQFSIYYWRGPDRETCQVQLLLNNGPITPVHQRLAKKAETSILTASDIQGKKLRHFETASFNATWVRRRMLKTRHSFVAIVPSIDFWVRRPLYKTIVIRVGSPEHRYH